MILKLFLKAFGDFSEDAVGRFHLVVSSIPNVPFAVGRLRFLGNIFKMWKHILFHQ